MRELALALHLGVHRLGGVLEDLGALRPERLERLQLLVEPLLLLLGRLALLLLLVVLLLHREHLVLRLGRAQPERLAVHLAQLLEVGLVCLPPLDVLLQRVERRVEVGERLLLDDQPLLALAQVAVELDQLLVLGVDVGADGHLRVLEQLLGAHVRELAHLVLRQKLQRVVDLDVERLHPALDLLLGDDRAVEPPDLLVLDVEVEAHHQVLPRAVAVDELRLDEARLDQVAVRVLLVAVAVHARLDLVAAPGDLERPAKPDAQRAHHARLARPVGADDAVELRARVDDLGVRVGHEVVELDAVDRAARVGQARPLRRVDLVLLAGAARHGDGPLGACTALSQCESRESLARALGDHALSRGRAWQNFKFLYCCSKSRVPIHQGSRARRSCSSVRRRRTTRCRTPRLAV